MISKQDWTLIPGDLKYHHSPPGRLGLGPCLFQGKLYWSLGPFEVISSYLDCIIDIDTISNWLKLLSCTYLSME